MSLGAYVKKRDFSRTAEPRGQLRKSAAADKAPRFVIQKHDASRLHYDFRLELGGTLKSWAVPKGVPFKKGEKRLAMQVEDHPVEYKDFEGTIPKGEYGGGTVMIWDEGTYEPLSDHPQKDLDGGQLHFALHGAKLDGEWTLVRMNRGAEKEWLLIKSGEDMRPVSKKKDNESAVTGRTMARIARDKDAEWR
jgi:bifunctional non-homologous end joining protein LigD